MGLLRTLVDVSHLFIFTFSDHPVTTESIYLNRLFIYRSVVEADTKLIFREKYCRSADKKGYFSPVLCHG